MFILQRIEKVGYFTFSEGKIILIDDIGPALRFAVKDIAKKEAVNYVKKNKDAAGDINLIELDEYGIPLAFDKLMKNGKWINVG
jgi:hypothetical protein